jgi:hypothetical protein
MLTSDADPDQQLVVHTARALADHDRASRTRARLIHDGLERMAYR